MCITQVCHACSQKRLQLLDTYADVPVRVCLDCSLQIDFQNKKPDDDTKTRSSSISEDEPMWVLSGVIKHDNLVREQFSYSYSPNVSLCLSFCQLHSANIECTKFLLYHCHRFEKLLRQKNGEIDYILVARMLHNLALAAKVRVQSSGVTFGESAECNTIIEHADIILLIVNNGCEALLPTEQINTKSLRKLRDDLVRAEKWNMAIDISLKLGEEVSSRVLASWGLSCLKAGCYETAREKFSRCLTRICTDDKKNSLLILIEGEQWKSDKEDFSDVRRPNKSPQLISLIISILESSAQLQQPEALMRANKIISSNTSLISIKSQFKHKEINLNEPAINIMNTIANLKQITQG